MCRYHSVRRPHTPSIADHILPSRTMLCRAMPLQGRYVHEATKHIPIIGDGDTGYGNAMNVKRTVKGYADAGFAGGGSGRASCCDNVIMSGLSADKHTWAAHLGCCLNNGVILQVACPCPHVVSHKPQQTTQKMVSCTASCHALLCHPPPLLNAPKAS
jgi:hypothetical protein